ncbi:protein kinase domain-containing protein [Planctomicrobium sp. SH527]|uniref:protein kinase domain-containing protein n=1 Tax=Planctomicrobium sp. SH527 TaxID=3448123 RepID=UPI003F5C70A6
MSVAEFYESDLGVMRRLDAICDAFEAAWRSGLNPRIEDYLASTSQANQVVLLGLLQELHQELSKAIWSSDLHPPTEKDSVSLSQFIPALLNLADGVKEDAKQEVEKSIPVPQENDTCEVREVFFAQFQVVSENGDFQILSSTGHDSLLIGRTDECRLCLDNDTSVSRIHARIEIHPPVCYLHDLNSSNGTFVNGARVNEAILNGDDVISVGRTKIIVRFKECDGDEISQQDTKPVPRKKPFAATENQVDQYHDPAFPRINGYQVSSPSGNDGFGPSYHALRVANKERCTIRVFPLSSGTDLYEVRKFAEHATPLVKMSHPHLVRLLEVGHYEDGLYLCSEPLSLRSWEDMVVGWNFNRRGRVAVGLMMQILTGLDYGHSLGLVHGAIQPANFVVLRIGPPFVAKLAGFGLAVASLKSGIRLPLKTEDAFPAEFMAPELYLSQEQFVPNFTPVADVYSAGATLYWLISGKAPVSRSVLSNRSQNATEEVYAPLNSICTGLSQELCEAIHRALSRDPANRYQSMKDMLRSLRSIS